MLLCCEYRLPLILHSKWVTQFLKQIRCKLPFVIMSTTSSINLTTSSWVSKVIPIPPNNVYMYGPSLVNPSCPSNLADSIVSSNFKNIAFVSSKYIYIHIFVAGCWVKYVRENCRDTLQLGKFISIYTITTTTAEPSAIPRSLACCTSCTHAVRSAVCVCTSISTTIGEWKRGTTWVEVKRCSFTAGAL